LQEARKERKMIDSSWFEGSNVLIVYVGLFVCVVIGYYAIVGFSSEPSASHHPSPSSSKQKPLVASVTANTNKDEASKPTKPKKKKAKDEKKPIKKQDTSSDEDDNNVEGNDADLLRLVSLSSNQPHQPTKVESTSKSSSVHDKKTRDTSAQKKMKKNQEEKEPLVEGTTSGVNQKQNETTAGEKKKKKKSKSEIISSTVPVKENPKSATNPQEQVEQVEQEKDLGKSEEDEFTVVTRKKKTQSYQLGTSKIFTFDCKSSPSCVFEG